jgi:hypothetical protein
MRSIVAPVGGSASGKEAYDAAKKKRRLRDALKNHTSFGCWFMFEFSGVRDVSSALGMQVLLCIEYMKCKGTRPLFFSGISRSGGNP